MKKFLITLFVAFTFCFAGATYYSNQAVSAQAETQQTTQPVVYVSVEPLDLVKNPAKYLNKNIKMKATFDKFTNLGLDYKPAMRNSQNYISFLILRDDVGENIIPLSEMKLFLTRKSAEKYIDLEVGDKIQIEGKVFSNALSDTWIDVSKIVVIQKKNKKA